MELLKKELSELEKVFERSKQKAYESYKNRNAIAKIGDIVTDGRTPIVVEKVDIMILWGNISITYSGNCVTSKLQPYKKYSKGYATQGSGFKVLK